MCNTIALLKDVKIKLFHMNRLEGNGGVMHFTATGLVKLERFRRHLKKTHLEWLVQSDRLQVVPVQSKNSPKTVSTPNTTSMEVKNW